MTDATSKTTMTALPPPPAGTLPAGPGAGSSPDTGTAGTAGTAGTPAPAPGLIRRALHPLIEARTWTATAYLLARLPLGIAWFTIVVSGVSAGFGMLVTLVGIPLLLGLLAFSRVISSVERSLCEALLGRRIASPFRPIRQPGLWASIKAVATDGAGWKGVIYGLIALPIGIVSFTVAVTVWSVAIGGVTFPLFGWIIPNDDTSPFNGWARFGLSLATFVVGVVFLLGAPWVMRGLGSANAALVRALLGRSDTVALQQRVEELTVSREASVDAAEAERRRIERDLHDGAQQRLVALAMDLGLAKDRLERGEDPAGTAELVGQAHDEAKRAITELRELVRGIHPAVLTDRGLDAALSAVAARCPIPVDLEVAPEVSGAGRPPAPVETTAYFVVTEALTNVAKHSHARSARVRVKRRGPVLVVEVTDDGIGGAAIERAGGLAGLADRVRAVEGTLRLASPAGGPTTLLAELPCGS